MPFSKPKYPTHPVSESLDLIEEMVRDKLRAGKSAMQQRAAMDAADETNVPGELSIKDLSDLTKILSATVLTRARHEKAVKEARDRSQGEEDPRVRGARLVRKVRQVLGIPVNDTDEPEQEYEDPFADVMRAEGLLPPKEEEAGSNGEASAPHFGMRLVEETDEEDLDDESEGGDDKSEQSDEDEGDHR